MQKRGIELAQAATGLAVDRHHGIGAQGRHQRAHPASEGRIEFVRVNQPEQAPEGVMGRDAVLELQMTAQPFQLLFRPQFDLDEDACARQHGIDGHHQQFDEVGFDLP